MVIFLGQRDSVKKIIVSSGWFNNNRHKIFTLFAITLKRDCIVTVVAALRAVTKITAKMASKNARSLRLDPQTVHHGIL